MKKRTWMWIAPGGRAGGRVSAITRSEARALIKAELATRRVPLGTLIEEIPQRGSEAA